MRETCQNPKCTLYSKKDKDNIVSNGTYQRKEGTLASRFLCKQCGKSFCGRVGTLFYDLRSPEKKVLMALKLLIKGMPLHRIGKILGIKFDTVRHWLKVASEQSGEIDAMLKKELGVSQAELDALWASVTANSLRQRAILWKARRVEELTP